MMHFDGVNVWMFIRRPENEINIVDPNGMVDQFPNKGKSLGEGDDLIHGVIFKQVKKETNKIPNFLELVSTEPAVFWLLIKESFQYGLLKPFNGFSCLLIGKGRKIFVEKIYANNSVFPTVSPNLLAQGQVTLPHRLEVTLPRFIISQLIIQIPHVVTSRQVAVYATGRGNQENDV